MKPKSKKAVKRKPVAKPETYSKYQVNDGKPWKPKTPRLDVQFGYCWVVNECGHVVGSFQLTENGRARAEENRFEAEAFFRKYYPAEASALLSAATPATTGKDGAT